MEFLAYDIHIMFGKFNNVISELPKDFRLSANYRIADTDVS